MYYPIWASFLHVQGVQLAEDMHSFVLFDETFQEIRVRPHSKKEEAVKRQESPVLLPMFTRVRICMDSEVFSLPHEGDAGEKGVLTLSLSILLGLSLNSQQY